METRIALIGIIVEDPDLSLIHIYGGRDHALLQRHHAGNGFHGAGGAQHMAGHGFGGTDIDIIGLVPQSLFYRHGLTFIVQFCAGACLLYTSR